jgi:putative inorganic carbon (HCO3(-)) transporter
MKDNSDTLVYLAAVFIGISLVIGLNLIAIKGIVIFIALMIALLVLWRVEVGIILLVLLLPFVSTTLVIGLVALTILSYVIKLFNGQASFTFTPLSLYLFIFAVVLVFSAVFSATPQSSLKTGVVWLLYLALYPVIVNTIKDKRILYLLLILLVVSATLQSLYGIYQYSFGLFIDNEGWADSELFADIKTRVIGTLDNPNILAQYLELIIPLGLALFWTTRDWARKMFFITCTMIMILCMLLTYSRAGWIALVLSVLVFGLLRDRKVLLLGVLGLFVAVYFLPSSFMNRLSSIGNLGESSTMYRTFIWKSALYMLKDFWFSGVGLGTNAFSAVYNQFYMREGVFAFHTHNLYLQLWIETGILGLLSFLTVVFVNIKHALSALLQSRSIVIKAILASLLAGLSGFLFHGLLEHSFYNLRILLLFWILLAFIMSISSMVVAAGDEKQGANQNLLPAGFSGDTSEES